MSSDEDNGDVVAGRGKLLQKHKREIKDLRDKCKNELKKTKDKISKRCNVGKFHEIMNDIDQFEQSRNQLQSSIEDMNNRIYAKSARNDKFSIKPISHRHKEIIIKVIMFLIFKFSQ